jgi:type IV secretion system protein VirB4
VVGPTGAGKSVLLALMALQFRRYAAAQVFAFDFGGSIRAAALAMGGDWHDLGGALSESATEPVALQPLSEIDEPAERAWAAEWLAGVLAREGVQVTPEVKDHLWSALSSLASAPHAEAHADGPVGAPTEQHAQARAPALLPRRTLGAGSSTATMSGSASRASRRSRPRG